MKVTSIELSMQDILDIVSAAAEGGMNYWAELDEYPWTDWYMKECDIPKALADDYIFFRVSDREGSDFKDLPVTPKVVRDGMMMLLNKYPHQVRIMGGDDLDVDATGAEMAIQLGLFGELVYG